MTNKQKEAYLIFGEFLFFSWKYGPVCGCCSMCINQENFFLNINESINSRDSENCSAGLMPTLSVWTQFWEPFHSIFSHERSSFYFPSSLPSLWNHNLNKISSPISIDSAVPLLYSRSQNEMNTVTLHVNVWQNPLQCCEVISLQLIKINEKKKGNLALYQIHSGEMSQIKFWTSWPQLRPSWALEAWICQVVAYDLISKQWSYYFL